MTHTVYVLVLYPTQATARHAANKQYSMPGVHVYHRCVKTMGDAYCLCGLAFSALVGSEHAPQECVDYLVLRMRAPGESIDPARMHESQLHLPGV